MMVSPEVVCLLMFVTTVVLLMAGFPVAFTLAGVSLIFAFIGFELDLIDSNLLRAIPNRIYGNAMNNALLIAVPLFVFMGLVLEKSKIAEELLEGMGTVLSRVPGGLGISVSIVGALLAASTGIVGATVVTMGLMSYPTMFKQGYKPSLAAGSICAAGTLGQIIPPSIVLILLTDQISNSYVEAQRLIGNWAPEPVSTGDLFAGALLPGLMLVGLYIVYQLVVAIINPKSSPKVQTDKTISLKKLLLDVMLPPILLIIAVLGSILGGLATPTEASAVGAIGALLLAGAKNAHTSKDRVLVKMGFLGFVIAIGIGHFVDLRLNQSEINVVEYIGITLAGLSILVIVVAALNSVVILQQEGIFKYTISNSTSITAKVMLILIGATIFSLIFRAFNGDEIVHEALNSIHGDVAVQIMVVMVVMFILGMFLDFIEITLVVVPLVAPVLLQHDISPVWLAIMMAINLQTSFLTPPFGFTLFYLRGVVSQNILKTVDMYRGVIPFLLIQILMLVILWYFPEIVNWLPRVIFGSDYSAGI